MSFVSFGRGRRPLVVIPGLSDGLRTVHGLAAPLALSLRAFARDHRVYVFSRRDGLVRGCSIREMAADQARAQRTLGIPRAAVLGVSQGGMIAQHLAAEHPEAVERLVLAVTAARANEVVREVVGRWIRMAESGDDRSLLADTVEKSSTPRRAKRLLPWVTLLAKLSAPRSLERFIVQAQACLQHDAREALGRIACPTFVVAGGVDRVVGGQAAAELAAGIPDARLHVFPELGHGAFQEAPDFAPRVLRFLDPSSRGPGGGGGR